MKIHFLKKHFYLLAILLASLVTCGFMHKQKPPSFSPAPFLAKQSVSYISRKSSLQEKSEKPEQKTGVMVKSLLFTKGICVEEVQRTRTRVRLLYSVNVLLLLCCLSFFTSLHLLKQYDESIVIRKGHISAFTYENDIKLDQETIEAIYSVFKEMTPELPMDIIKYGIPDGIHYFGQNNADANPMSFLKKKNSIGGALMILSVVAINVYYYLFQHKKVYKTATLKRYFNPEVLLANIFLLFFFDMVTQVYYIAYVLYGAKQVQQQNVFHYFKVADFFIVGCGVLTSSGELNDSGLSLVSWKKSLFWGNYVNNYQVEMLFTIDFLDKNRNSVCTAYALFTCPKKSLTDQQITSIDSAFDLAHAKLLPAIIRSITYHFLKKKQNSLLAHINHACVQMSSLSVLIRFWQTFFIFCGLFFSIFYVGCIRAEKELLLLRINMLSSFKKMIVYLCLLCLGVGVYAYLLSHIFSFYAIYTISPQVFFLIHMFVMLLYFWESLCKT